MREIGGIVGEGGIGAGDGELVREGGMEEGGGVDVGPSWLAWGAKLGGEAILTSIGSGTSPAMLGGPSWGDDRREKGEIPIPFEGLLGVDGVMLMLIGVGCVDRIADGGRHSLGVWSLKWRVLILLEVL
jgi:hypothetical protein